MSNFFKACAAGTICILLMRGMPFPDSVKTASTLFMATAWFIASVVYVVRVFRGQP